MKNIAHYPKRSNTTLMSMTKKELVEEIKKQRKDIAELREKPKLH